MLSLSTAREVHKPCIADTVKPVLITHICHSWPGMESRLIDVWLEPIDWKIKPDTENLLMSGPEQLGHMRR
jgi:hypothetical protein